MSTTGLWGADEFPAMPVEVADDPAGKSPDNPAGTAAPASAPEPAPPEPQKFTRTIDLGDGSGVQKFEADTAEGLIDALAKAQENATRKIRSLNARLKLGDEPGRPPAAPPAPQVPAREPRPLTTEEAFAIGQQLQSDPTKAFESLMASQVGMTPKELREAVAEARQFRAQMQEREHASAFVTAHPDFKRSPKNAERVNRYLELHRLPPTFDSFERAYQDLSESGLLELTEPQRKGEEGERIAAPETPRRQSQGALPARNGARAAATQARGLPSDEEAEKMPLAELRARLIGYYSNQ